MLLMLLAIAVPLTLEWVVARPGRWRLAAFALLVAVGSMTHYFFLLPLFSGLLWVWLTPHGRSTRLRVTAAASVGLVPLLLWLPIVIYQAGRVNEYFPAFGIRRTLSVYSVFFASGSVWQGQGPGYPARSCSSPRSSPERRCSPAVPRGGSAPSWPSCPGS